MFPESLHKALAPLCGLKLRWESAVVILGFCKEGKAQVLGLICSTHVPRERTQDKCCQSSRNSLRPSPVSALLFS